MWTPLRVWSEQVAPSAFPRRPKQKQEASEESDISNTPTVMLHEVRMEGLLCPHLLLSPTGTTVVMVLGLGRTAALRPTLLRE